MMTFQAMMWTVFGMRIKSVRNEICKIINILTTFLYYSEQCGIVSGIFKTSCKTGEGVSEMFREIAKVISTSSRSRQELFQLEQSFKLTTADIDAADQPENCAC